ncbi:unnamed protein product [Ixodes hexagonus]
MELLVHGLGQGRHIYNPFPKDKPPALKAPRTLQDLCNRTVIRQATLRGLKGRVLPSLPPLIRKQLTSLETDDFVEVECAPFRDIFDFNMYHRALTYRVTCPLDGCEYMAAHAGTFDSSRPSDGFWQWVQLSHPNLMCVYALARDAKTANVFLVMDIPEATLKRLEIFLVSQGLCFPEYFLWKVARQLSSVIMYVEDQGLAFGRFDLKNVYIVGDKLLLDNKLTWKSWVDSFSFRNRVQSIFLGDKVNIGGHYEVQANSPSNASVVCLGFVLTKLASIALVDRRPSVGLGNGGGGGGMSGKIPFFDGFDPLVPEGPVTYSSELFDLLVALHSTNPPTLATIHAKAVEMMGLLAAKGGEQVLVHREAVQRSDKEELVSPL